MKQIGFVYARAQKRLNLYKIVRRPPCWKSTARLARLDLLDWLDNVERVESSRVEPSGIWAYFSFKKEGEDPDPLARSSVVRTSVFNWRTFPDLRLIYGWHVTTSWVRCPLWVNQPGQLSLPSPQGW